MKQEDTKQKILDKALELFSEYGYDSVSVGQIAQAVGIKAPSLYNHFPGKQAIFDAIVESTAARYAEGTDRLSVHVQDARRDVPEFSQITADELFDKLKQERHVSDVSFLFFCQFRVKGRKTASRWIKAYFPAGEAYWENSGAAKHFRRLTRLPYVRDPLYPTRSLSWQN